MAKKHTINQAEAFFARVAMRKEDLAKATKELNRTIGEGVEELGATFSHNEQEYAIRSYQKSGKFTICKYEKRPGSHNVARVDLTEALDLPTEGNLVEVAYYVGEEDPNWAPTGEEPSTVVI